MKRSRLNLFKATSMTISVLGVVMIIITVVIVAYLGFQSLSSIISSDASSGKYYEQLTDLKSDYSNLKAQFDSTKTSVDTSGKRI